MKKVFTIIAILFTLISKAQYVGSYGLIDNGPTPGGNLFWQYSWDGGINYTLAYIMQFDSAFIRIRPLNSAVASINTNIRLTGVSSDGTLSPFDISALPTNTLSLLGNKSSSTVSGLLGVTGYTVTHGLSYTPTLVQIQPSSANAAALSYVDNITSTTFRVNFLSVPVVGTNNISFKWVAYK